MTDHRKEAERWACRLPEAQSTGNPLPECDRTALASMHALLAIHDLLDERLPESQPRNSTPEGAVWRPEGLTVAEAGEAARTAAKAVREAHSGDSGIRPELDTVTVTLPRAPIGHYPSQWSPKGLREHLCQQQTFAPDERTRWTIHILIDLLDTHRPIGPDGKHDERHTGTCGCAL